tara:strand:+ start:3078 stop:3677 length:600 start_codon:yes stop_codon:yes gene_type:complete
MTNIRLHGVLAKEYGQNFCLSVGRPKNVLHAIDANRDGFIARVIQLYKEGCVYEVIINKKRFDNQEDSQDPHDPETIDLVPAITGSGPAFFLPLLGGSVLLANIASAVFFAAVSYALTPQPEVQQVEATAQANKQSQIFNNIGNVASQGAPLPLGYGRLKVGSQIIQSTVKSYPQHQRVEEALGSQKPNNGGLATTTTA